MGNPRHGIPDPVQKQLQETLEGIEKALDQILQQLVLLNNPPTELHPGSDSVTFGPEEAPNHG